VSVDFAGCTLPLDDDSSARMCLPFDETLYLSIEAIRLEAKTIRFEPSEVLWRNGAELTFEAILE